MREQRVAIYLPSLEGGGAERMMIALAQGLADRGKQVDLILARGGERLLGLAPANVRIIKLKARMTITSLPRWLRYLRREAPDVVFSALNANIVALIAKKWFHKDIALIARQDITISSLFVGSGLKAKIALSIGQRLLPHADAIVAVSEGVLDDFKHTVPRAAHLVTTITNPVVTANLAELAAQPVQHPWFHDPDIPVILTAGRLTRQKDHPTLLKAFAEVVEKRPARLVIFGEGPDLSALKALARRLQIIESVDFPGFQDNPLTYMAKAQLFVLSSLFEGLPSVLVEAMACGTPVVSTDCPSGPREILENGRWGRLVPVGDSSALAEAIIETLDHPPDQEPLIARAWTFSAESSIDRYMALLDALCAR